MPRDGHHVFAIMLRSFAALIFFTSVNATWFVQKVQYLGRNYCSTGTEQGTAVAKPSGSCDIGEKATCGGDGSSIFYQWGCDIGTCHDCIHNTTLTAGGQCHTDARGTPYTWSCVRESELHHNVRCESFTTADCTGTTNDVTYDFGNANSGFCVACNRSGSRMLELNQCSKLVCLNCRSYETHALLKCEKKGSTGSQYCTCGPPL